MPTAAVSPIRRERPGDATRALLFDAAIEEFKRVGFDRASVARIARRAGVSRPSFYFHFPTREHVLFELQAVLEREAVDRVKRCRGLEEALREFVAAQIDTEAAVGDPALYRDMLRIYASGPGAPPIDGEIFPTVQEMRRHFREAAANGELRAGLDPDEATHLFLSGVFGLLIGTPGPPAGRRQHLETLVTLFLAESTA